MSRNWTPKQLKYIKFLADPEESRSKSQFAQEIKVSLRTLFRWQEKEGFWDAVYELAKVHLKGELAPVLRALARQARKGDVSAIKLILQQTGKLRKEPEQEVKVVISWDEGEEAVASCGAS
ncbi:hypothetical protein HKBW3S09_00819 [Candidatus Hakubella thermalkaliphila]|uniref:Homeodomain phBC6A51-type domain-containing protein n=1 Tax=Candidatus Hakubella thermalkaliphila TaxID=2754717 RepID=A0A6V8QEK1_9ACTN|nr:phBC6A51 family helix-turn-helix protein [Candidatus Hakubella thermalkaliphila]MBT9168012.1 hypothetical protein [Bacillota bacterium]GFP23352.1 hypothetical protein HKBW3S09_00819 [Candidatus Hakubella thermalkaliphila]GFP30769.1 hypothetical protein HKBW3S34_01688 [Candidatus Hakubella thermalkaliphila]GFP39242.1 hypothetical protein HKBW3S47_00942 [Candidatus Hakubella thermalkaliphila]GFP42820.1 hypothetical protein HKBW3C_01944 [Candidatus Hakubella thermalkaliphila]